MKKLFRMYRKEFPLTGEIRHSFSVQDANGCALEFWYHEFPEKITRRVGLQNLMLGGVERHTIKPMDYDTEDSKRPSCMVLGQSCYHDGSSLWAEKYMEDRLNHEETFMLLEADHEKHFADAKFK